MAIGDIILDAFGNVALTSNGEVRIDNGNQCCWIQAKNCLTNSYANLWVHSTVSMPRIFKENGECYYVAADHNKSMCPGPISDALITHANCDICATAGLCSNTSLNTCPQTKIIVVSNCSNPGYDGAWTVTRCEPSPGWELDHLWRGGSGEPCGGSHPAGIFNLGCTLFGYWQFQMGPTSIHRKFGTFFCPPDGAYQWLGGGESADITVS